MSSKEKVHIVYITQNTSENFAPVQRLFIKTLYSILSLKVDFRPLLLSIIC